MIIVIVFFLRRLDSNIELLKASSQRAQLHFTRLHWLHEDMFMQDGRQNNPMMLANRATVMSEIKKVMFILGLFIHPYEQPFSLQHSNIDMK